MNYRHLYHAGNLGDVLKHAVLAAAITYLKNKPAPFRVIDTHAGIGCYDLTSDQAGKTGEWRYGIGRVLGAEIPADVRAVLAPWLDVVAELNGPGALTTYPGSPLLARKLLRRQDRLTLTELHPADFTTLAGLFAGDIQVKTIELDGWLALGSFVPPKERRGLVLIDPAYEAVDEFDRLHAGLTRALARWQGGTYIVWYPVKDRKAVGRLHRRIVGRGTRKVLAAELASGRIAPDAPMKASGLMIINPPWPLKDQLERILPWLADTMATGPGAGWSVTELAGEA